MGCADGRSRQTERHWGDATGRGRPRVPLLRHSWVHSFPHSFSIRTFRREKDERGRMRVASSWTQSPGAGAGWWGSGVSWARANVEGQRGGAQHGKGPSRAAEGTERLTRALGSSPGRRGASFIPHLWGLVLHGKRAGMLTVLSGCKHPELLLIPVASTLVPVTLLPLIWFQCTVSDPVGSRGPAASCDPGAICSLRFCQFRILSAASKTQIED